MYLLLSLVKELCEISRLKLSRLGVAPRWKMNLLPFPPSLHLPPHSSIPPQTTCQIKHSQPNPHQQAQEIRFTILTWFGREHILSHTQFKGSGGCMMRGSMMGLRQDLVWCRLPVDLLRCFTGVRLVAEQQNVGLCGKKRGGEGAGDSIRQDQTR